MSNFNPATQRGVTNPGLTRTPCEQGRVGKGAGSSFSRIAEEGADPPSTVRGEEAGESQLR